MDKYLILEIWRYLILIGYTLNDLKNQLLLINNKSNLLEIVETCEENIFCWYDDLTKYLAIDNVDFENLDIDLPMDKLAEELGIVEDSFDFITFDFSSCYYGLKKLKGNLYNLKSLLKADELDIKSIILTELIEGFVQDLIEIMKLFI